jgi:hypothetical protein
LPLTFVLLIIWGCENPEEGGGGALALVSTGPTVYAGGVLGNGINYVTIEDAAFEDAVLEVTGNGTVYAGGIAGSSLCPIAESVTGLTIDAVNTRARAGIRLYAGGIAGVIGADSPLTKNGSTVTINAQSTQSIWVGGIVGNAPYSSPISKSYAHITMDIKNTALTGQGSVNVGGIVGNGTARTNTDLDVRVIEQCYATGSITAVSGGASEGGYSIRAGGLVGAPGTVTIIDSYAMVNIDADASAGGSQADVGGISGFNTGKIINTYSTGTLRGVHGGLGASGNSFTGSATFIGGISSGTHVPKPVYDGNAALSPSITAVGPKIISIGRVAPKTTSGSASAESQADLTNNIAWEGMVLYKGTTGSPTVYTPTGYGANDTEGASISTAQKETQATYDSGGLGWDFATVWAWDGSGKRPVLRWENEE